MTNITASKIIHCVRSIASSCINIALSVSLLLTLFGCATTEIRSFSSPIPEDIRKNSYSVAVIPVRFTPATNLVAPFKKGRNVGAATGAAPGIAGAMVLLALGPYGIVLLPAAVVAAGVGATVGAIEAMPAEEVAKIEATLNRILQQLDMQNTMAENIVFRGIELTPYRFVPLKGPGPSAPDVKPDFTLINGQGNDIALEVGVLKMGFQELGGKRQNPSLSFFMHARVRAFQIRDSAELHADIFRYVSRERKFSEWAENGALRLREALETGYAEIAVAAIERMFLLYEVKVDSIWSSIWLVEPCMLKPLYPPQASFRLFGSGQLNFPEVDTLQPTLKWESFPREKDREADSLGILNRVSDITYELKVWKGKDGYPEELIYSRRGLSLPEHTIETPLQIGTEYFWTVRSRFKLDGQERLTRWSYSQIPWVTCREDLIPLHNYHRFKITFK